MVASLYKLLLTCENIDFRRFLVVVFSVSASGSGASPDPSRGGDRRPRLHQRRQPPHAGRARDHKAVIPQKSTEIIARQRKGSAGGRPPAFDAVLYKDRNVVERSFGLTKQWRGLATRYDKLAITYRAAVVLQTCIRWLHLLGDTL